ncbi:hypothetical protein QUA07_24365 [Microcoleus sp. T3_A4]|uniref:hypothetical protein n=1 Tax=Microcoleus sp. T3_A4 TaxID=2818968 RepID=UPI002FD13A8C
MAQIRAVMPTKFVPLADELLNVTGVADYSTLITLLLSRYGNHLKSTWQIDNSLPSAPAIAQPIAETSTAPEPFTQLEF